jgi:hypothetical protein
MRSGVSTVMAVLLLAASAGLSQARSIGEPVPLGPRALALQMERNPEIAGYIARRGYPDWAEEVEVDSNLPLGAYEVRLYYLRLDREIRFTDATILGRPEIGIRRYDCPLAPAMRERIEQAYLAHDPARRAELAAERALESAERAENAADGVVEAADRAERVAKEAASSFLRRLRK